MSSQVLRPLRALLVLHGYGADPAGAAELADAVDPGGHMLHVVPSGPLQTPGGRAWFDPTRNGRAGVLGETVGMIDAVIAGMADQGIDPGEMAIIGWSQGGAAGLAALGRSGSPPIGALALLGAFSADDPELEFSPANLPRRVFSAHGEHDDVVPIEFADDLAKWMKAEGVEVESCRHSGGHELPGTVVDALSTWLTGSTS